MRYACLLCVCLLAKVAVGQSPVKDKLYAPALKDSVEYAVYFPADWEGWDAAAKHPVIYAIGYGMIDGDYLAAQVSYFRKARYAMPNSLIVVIKASMQRMGYSYDTGLLSAEGLDFVAFLKRQLIPEVERKYNAAPFRTYIGHSFASSFANYLFLNEPGLFNGYVLLAPEKIDPEKPPFHLSESDRAYYNQHYTFYYTAVGQNDIQRRRDYAKEIQHEVSGLDTSRFFFRYDSIARADHTNILTLAIEFALKHIYQYYTPSIGHNQKDAAADLRAVALRIKEMYGIDIEQNFTFYAPFAREAVANKDSVGLISVLSYFKSDRLKGWNIMQFGDFCMQLKLSEPALRYYERAIEKITSKEMDQDIGPGNLLACYNSMAFKIWPQEPEKAWAYLKKALQLSKLHGKYIPKNGEALLSFGKFSALYNYRTAEGQQYLLDYLADKRHTDEDMANYYAAKNYVWLKQPEKARAYAQKALTENSNNKPAAELLKQLP